MIHHVEPRPGPGGQAATLVAVAAIVVVLGAIALEAYQTFFPAPPPPPATSFRGSFGRGTATCPDSTKEVNGSVCAIAVAPVGGAIRADLRWDTTDPLSLAIVDAKGANVAPPQTGSDGNAGVVLNATGLTGSGYTIRVTDTTATGPIDFTVGTG